MPRPELSVFAPPFTAEAFPIQASDYTAIGTNRQPKPHRGHAAACLGDCLARMDVIAARLGVWIQTGRMEPLVPRSLLPE